MNWFWFETSKSASHVSVAENFMIKWVREQKTHFRILPEFDN
jgi:hypothetical protein